MTQPYALTIATAAERIRTQQLSPVTLVQSCLDRLDQLEPQLRAWVTVDSEGALATASAVRNGNQQRTIPRSAARHPTRTQRYFLYRRDEDNDGVAHLRRLCPRV